MESARPASRRWQSRRRGASKRRRRPAPATPATDAFKPDYQIKAAESVNFRAGPSTGDQILQALPPATPLQYLNEDAPATNPNDGPRWMKFKIEDGTVGWIRQIDTESYKP